MKSIIKVFIFFCLIEGATAQICDAFQSTVQVIMDTPCVGDSGSIEVEAIGGVLPYEYSLLDNTSTEVFNSGFVSDALFVFSFIEAGDYIIEVLDSQGCLTQNIATISSAPPLLADAIFTDISCSGDQNGLVSVQASGGSPPYNFELFESSTNTILASNTDGVFDNLSADEYIINVVDSFGCVYTTSFLISDPDPLLLTVTTTDVLCVADSGVIVITTTGGNPPYQYSIIDGVFQTENIFSNLSAGTYVVEVLDSSGCRVIVSGTIAEPLPLILELNNDVEYISESDNNIVVNVVGGVLPFQYRLTSANMGTVTNDTGIFSQIGQGEYSIEVIDDVGCIFISTIVISYDDSNSDGISDNDEDVNGNGNLDDDDTDGDGIPDYLDDDDDNDGVNSSGEINTSGKSIQKMTAENFLDTDEDGIPNHRDMDDDGDGVLTIDEDFNGNGDPTDDDTDNSGIPDYLEKEVAVLSVQENELTDNFSFFPNPAVSNLVLEFNDLKGELLEVSFFDINGTKILTKKEVNINQSLAIDVSSFSTGIYFVQIRNGDRFGVKKLSVR